MALSRHIVLSLIVSALCGFNDVCHAMITGVGSKTSKTSSKTKDCPITTFEGQDQHQRREVLKSALVSFSLAHIVFTNHPKKGFALSPDEASTAYDSYASSYDTLDGGSASSIFGIDQARSELFSKARGSILEIGAGTGLNLEKYNLSQLESLTLLDISEGMLLQAQKRISTSPVFSNTKLSISFVKADATSDLVSKFGMGSFDTVVDSFSLCTMGNEGAERCLDQIRQVVKSKEHGGQVLLLENSRSSNPLFGLYQDATADAAAGMGGKGCVYNQNVESMIQSTKGMKIEQQELYAAGLFRSFQCSIA